MNKVFAGLAVSLAALVGATGAQAADPIMMVDAPAIEMATSNWDGPYAGIGVIFETAAPGTPAETVIGGQAVLGINMTADSFLFGGELYVAPWNSSTGGFGASFGGEVRAGLIVSDPLVLYVAGGGEITDGGNTYGSVGGGAEFMVADDLSLDLEYKFLVGINNANRYHHVGLSANWHF
jgi:opacity protein-like surface antigen